MHTQTLFAGKISHRETANNVKRENTIWLIFLSKSDLNQYWTVDRI
jgi:hypothetical protein